MLYITYLIILDCQSLKKISFGNFQPRPENCISRLCPGPLGEPPLTNTQIG